MTVRLLSLTWQRLTICLIMGCGMEDLLNRVFSTIWLCPALVCLERARLSERAQRRRAKTGSQLQRLGNEPGKERHFDLRRRGAGGVHFSEHGADSAASIANIRRDRIDLALT